MSHPIDRPPYRPNPQPREYEALRRDMVTHQLLDIRDPRVLEAMATVPRHLFVPERLREVSYADTPLPIGFDQTISQPLMVAIMLEAALLRGNERVLEIGTGSGYQAALLARLAKDVYTVEIIPELADLARANLAAAGVDGVQVITADGSLGWPEAAPYDAIIVAAGAPVVPDPLVAQLAQDGRLIIPVGPRFGQVLKRLRRTERGVQTETFGGCAFVPLVGTYGASPPEW